MKKAFAFFTLLLGCVAMFAQSGPTFPYQAVVRNSQNQLIKDSTFAVDVAIYQGTTLKFSETQSVTTNANGQFTMNIGGGAVVSGAMNNVTDWSVAKFKVTCHLSGGDIVSENAVSPVPYALQAANATSAATGNFLTSDSAVITTMQSEIAALQAASLDCNDVKNCIADTLNAYTPTTQLCNAVKDCDFSGNTSIINLLQTLSDQIAAQNRVVDSLAHIVDSLSDLAHGTTPGEVSCEQVMECMGDTLDRLNARITSQGETITTQGETIATQGETITAQGNTITAQGNTIDSLSHIVDSLSNLPHGGGDTPDTPTAFTCGTSKVTDVDGNEYNTVKIGNQCWMKENLRTSAGEGVYPKKNNGNDDLTADEQIIYGRLYTWRAATKDASTTYPTNPTDTLVHGICPTGWHVPSNAEWDTLTTYVNKEANGFRCNGDGTIAKALASKTGWTTDENACYVGNNPENNNATGFSAVPAGIRLDSDFEYFGDRAYFWSATDVDSYVWARYLESDDSNVYWSNGSKDNVYSVRCLRDAGIGGGDEPSEPDTPVTPTDTFDCGTDKVKDVQNNEYNTVKIGNQCWTKENLRTNVGTGDYGYPTGVSGTADTVTYGRLYSWAAVMNDAEASSDVPSRVQGICPEGWHVPSDGEWGNLINYVKNKNEYVCDGEDNIANALSSETGWTNGSAPGCNAGESNAKRNLTGFSAVPAGKYADTAIGTNAYFWSTTKINDIVRYYILGSDSSIVSQGFEFSENMGLSVRCLRN